MKNTLTMTNGKTAIEVIVGEMGFIDCYKNETLFLTPEGKRLLGIPQYTQKSSQSA